MTDILDRHRNHFFKTKLIPEMNSHFFPQLSFIPQIFLAYYLQLKIQTLSNS